jgi:hypothetical protein
MSALCPVDVMLEIYVNCIQNKGQILIWCVLSIRVAQTTGEPYFYSAKYTVEYRVSLELGRSNANLLSTKIFVTSMIEVDASQILELKFYHVILV